MTTFWLMTPAMTATMETLGCRSCLLRPGCRSKTPCILKSPDARRESIDRHASARHSAHWRSNQRASKQIAAQGTAVQGL